MDLMASLSFPYFPLLFFFISICFVIAIGTVSNDIPANVTSTTQMSFVVVCMV